MNDETSSFALALARDHGIKVGDRVAIFLPNSWQFVVALYGVWKAGVVAVLVGNRSSSRELAFNLKDSGSRAIIAESSKSQVIPKTLGLDKIAIDSSNDESFAKKSSHFETPKIPSSSIACLMYTGGTTGSPKGAMLTHESITTVLSGLSQAWSLRRGSEVFAQFLPMTHGGGLNCNLNSALFSHGTTVIMRRFNAESLLHLIVQHRVTAFAGVPSVFASLIGSSELASTDLSSLRICFLLGGGAI